MMRTLLSLFLALSVATTSSVVDAFAPPSSSDVVAARQPQRGIASSSPSPKLKGASNNNARSSTTAMYAAKKKSSTPKTAKKAAAAKQVKEDTPEVVNFKKAEFVSAISAKTGLTKSESENALSSILSIITEELAVGKKRISLPGFGTFKLTYRAARKGRNPKTGEEIDIKESYSPSFTASKTFKDLCNPDR
jgi:DNA-binding protein HU-beta